MRRMLFTVIVILAIVLAAEPGSAQSDRWIRLIHADTKEVILKPREVMHTIGSVIYETETATIYCDSAVWVLGSDVNLLGRVLIDDKDYRLAADDSVHYNLSTTRMEAFGSYVELWSKPDSLMAVGRHAFYDRTNRYFYMLDRPTLFLNYPDTANLVEVVGDLIEYDAVAERAEASGDVWINSPDITATSGCAVMRPRKDLVDLYDKPVMRRHQSEISGRLISIMTEDRELRSVDVIDSARAEFTEPTDSSETYFDQSILSGERIIMSFPHGELNSITCVGQAYSWYFPSSRGQSSSEENSVSGDSIIFTIENEQLQQVDVFAGAVGSYLKSTVDSVTIDEDSTKLSDLEATVDSTASSDSVSTTDSLVITTDTIDYQAEHIRYSLKDSLITLMTQAQTVSGPVELAAHLIELKTKTRVIEAYSASPESDTTGADNIFVDELQPNEIPVMLKDGNELLYGDYLRYSIDTEKGHIVTSKSKYETGFFYGHDLYRQDRDVFYLTDGRYTTCDADEPHFHFLSKNLKLIEGNKLIAKPVVLYIGRLPILALPYYVFPLEKGRHSGILPFTLGNIERGERYIRNVGYYWAVSKYWDWQGALDYFEERNSLNLFSSIAYRKIYAFDGRIAGNFARETNYDAWSGQEAKRKRWTISASHNQDITPTFKFSATGHIQSDASYYNDFSTNLDQRLNRVVRSQVNFTKKFGRTVSVSGKAVHDENLDKESRTDRLPELGISLPAFRPFGEGKLNDEGRLERRWYNEFIITYRPSLTNFSSRVMASDSTIADESGTGVDTVIYRSRKKYTRIDHSARLSFPTKIFSYLTFNPSLSYTENWYKVHRTVQSDRAGIDAMQTYRAYLYNVGTSMSTKLYGTVYPNVLGLVGLRQVITPTISYRFTPEVNKHPEIRSYAGGGAGSSRRSQSMTVSMNHVYQAKVKTEETERNFELMSVTSSFSYNFEAEERKFTNLSTRFTSTLLPKINFYGNLDHSLYKKDSDELDFWKPRLLNFNINAGIKLTGRRFLFDDVVQRISLGADSASHLTQSKGGQRLSTKRRGWNLSASYGYSETNLGTNYFRKKSFIRLMLQFNLTPSTEVSFSQYYDFVDKKTINNEVRIERKLHCWTGRFHWVPTGSNRGWGFELFVTALPEVRIDNSQNTLSSSYFQGMR